MVDSHRETELRRAIESFFFGYRAFTALPDRLLAERGLGRTHHRILYFVRRESGITMAELLAVLGITKQAAHRPLKDLEAYGYVEVFPDTDDRRVRRLRVTDEGRDLEAALSAAQMRLLEEVFRDVGPDVEHAWRSIMVRLADDAEGASS